MGVEILMPKLSDSMEEATVVHWYKAVGDPVRRGEALVEVETDKATIVYEAEQDGTLDAIVVAAGASAALGAPIARLRATDTNGTPGPAPVPSPASAAPAAPSPASAASHGESIAPRADRARATPVARRVAMERGVSLADLAGSGPGGRITVRDVESAAATATPSVATPPVAGGRGTVEEIVLSPTQRTIARRMSESRTQVPEFTLEMEIPMDAALRVRADLRAGGVEPLPSVNDLVVMAVGRALREFPALNASFDDGRVLRYSRVNVGVAVDAGDALLVPVVRDADRLRLGEIAAETRRLAELARTGSLAPSDLGDGTFTVSNLGMFGVRRFHAIINRPEAAILAVGAVAPRPVVADDGSFVAQQTMDVTLACDHRAVYGAEAARFLSLVRTLLADPTLLL